MRDPTTFGLFVAAALALLLVPGPAVFYVVTRDAEGGRLVGLVSCLGIEVGTLAHAAFAAVGLSALLASSVTAFAVVKWLGAAYLIWLGLLTDGLYALLGGTASVSLRRRSTKFRWAQRYVSGGVYLALGAASAASCSGKD